MTKTSKETLDFIRNYQYQKNRLSDDACITRRVGGQPSNYLLIGPTVPLLRALTAMMVIWACFGVNYDALASSATGFDVNDVSVLFPLDHQSQPIPYISLASLSQNSDLISSSIFDDVLQKSRELNIAQFSRVRIHSQIDWRVVGFRYDSCAPHDRHSPRQNCLHELRLIAQPLEHDFGPFDSALHLIYRFGSGEPQADDLLLHALLNLKRQAEAMLGSSSDGKPLGVHPLLERALVLEREDVIALFKQFILRHAVSERLAHVAMMGLFKGDTADWIFFGGDVHNGTWQHESIPNLPAPQNMFVRLNVRGSSKSFLPVPVDAKLSTAQFFNTPKRSLKPYLEDLSQAAYALENPALSDRNNSDCLSCHAATTMRLAEAFGVQDAMPHFTSFTPRNITAFPAPRTLQHHPRHSNLRAFGYFGINPTVSMRTVLESGRVAARLNQTLGLIAPGPDCSLVERQVMNCFVNSVLNQPNETTSEQCLSACKAN